MGKENDKVVWLAQRAFYTGVIMVFLSLIAYQIKTILLMQTRLVMGTGSGHRRGYRKQIYFTYDILILLMTAITMFSPYIKPEPRGIVQKTGKGCLPIMVVWDRRPVLQY